MKYKERKTVRDMNKFEINRRERQKKQKNGVVSNMW